jgi:protein involved in polysaccharide export with SLBB domain
VTSAEATVSDEKKASQPARRWLQVSLRTLLAMVFGFGLGLAVNYSFRPGVGDLPDPSRIRLGDRVTIEIDTSIMKPSRRTVRVLADGTISLPNLGQVPASGLSLDELTQDLKQRLTAYCLKIGYTKEQINVNVFVSFDATSVED